MLWADTTAGIMKMRNGANSAWISLWELDGTFIATDISLSAGSAAAPSLFFTGDTNTGLFSPGADTVALATAGSNRLHITSAGLVGIGVSGPSSLLHLVSSGQPTITVADDGGRTLQVKAPDGSANPGFVGTTTNHDLLLQAGTTAGGLNVMRFNTAGSERVRITDTGNVGIGSASPDGNLTIGGLTNTGGQSVDAINVNRTDGVRLFGVKWDVTSNEVRFSGNTKNYVFRNGSSEAETARIDSSGRLLVGTSTSPSAGDGQYAVISAVGYAGSPTGTGYFAVNHGTAATSLASGSTVANVSFGDNTGATFARIQCQVDATPGANDYPGRLVFSTTADGAASPTERVRIDSAGAVLFKKTTKDYTTEGTVINQGASSGVDTSFVTAGGAVATFARSTNDGTIISLRQDGTEEGTISVSGTTISYNGAHLSCWSQLPSGVERTEILRGSVLSNLDEMCEWTDEDNEQLNRMKVSDVEGDKNVSGVFQCWDDDDDTYTDDFYCAMTGDFIIRIAEGVTVERGDLLMSAGDGTAKPQDDDIIRSKTVAKVTSTNVSCTYDDGSYCVPCVLMAC